MKINSSVAVVCFLPGRAKDLSAHLYYTVLIHPFAANDISNITPRFNFGMSLHQ